MEQRQEDLPHWNVTLSIDDVRLLHHSVSEAIKYWPGAPARPQEEQEFLWYTRDWLQRIILENTLQSM